MKILLKHFQEKLKDLELIPEKDAGNVYTFVGGDAHIEKKVLSDIIFYVERRIEECQKTTEAS